MRHPDDPLGKMIALREEVEQLKHAIVSHAVVDQAIGVVIAYGGLHPDSAWNVLKAVSQNTNTKLREVAEHILQWPRCEWLPPEIRQALNTALENDRRPGEDAVVC
jgi:hypothetical protein